MIPASAELVARAKQLAEALRPIIEDRWLAGENKTASILHVAGAHALAAWDSFESAQLAPETREVTDLDRAWRAVDALGGTHQMQSDYQRGYGHGYDQALKLACEAIENLGGRDVPGADQ